MFTAKEIKNICCIGAGYVGGPTMAVLADKCPFLNIYVVDLNQERIQQWNSKDTSELPIFEPGLEQIIKRVRGKNLFFSFNVEKYISIADMVFLSVNTPTKTKGVGSGQASDLSCIEACARQVAKSSKGHTIVVEKSTIPVKTAETIKLILKSTEESEDIKLKSFSILSNPEFLAEGTAINDLENPDRILIGGEDEESINYLSKIYEEWVSPKKIIKTNLWSSELSKLIANAFLAQRVSSINSISALCEKTGADINQVSSAIGADSRIGSKFLVAGPGFGGSCFKKDILNLVYLCNYFGLPEVADYWKNVININDWQQKRLSEIIVEKLFGTLTGKKIVILGFSFKAKTNDTRESPSIKISRYLLEEGAHLVISDPKVSQKQVEEELKDNQFDDSEIDSKLFSGTWEFSNNFDSAFDHADAVVVLTDWPEYKKLQWQLICKRMRKPAWVFDTRSVVDDEAIKNIGLNIWKLGSNY